MRTSILLVEDEELITLFIREALGPAGFDVLSLPDATSAVQALETIQISCAIIDVGLPGIAGDDLARQIRQRWPTLPIILVTGYEPYSYAAGFAADPWIRVLPKPFGEGALLEMLESFVGMPQQALEA